MKKPKHLTIKNYEEANSSHERTALVAEVFEYATKLEENFNGLTRHLNTRLANLNQHLGALDSEASKNLVDKALDPLVRFDRGLLKGKISEIEDTLRLPALMVTTNFISELCPCCNGTGKVEGPEPDDVGICLHCAGTGVKGEDTGYTHTMTGFLKSSETQDTCPSCGGTGVKGEGLEMGQEYCPTCSGTGTGTGTAAEKPKATIANYKAVTLNMEELVVKLNNAAPGVCAGYVSHRTPYTHDGKTFTLTISEAIMRSSPAATAELFKATTLFTNMDIVYKDNIGVGLPVKKEATRNDVENIIAKLVDIHSDVCGTLIATDKGFTLQIRETELTKGILAEALNTYSNLYLKNV